VVGTSNLKYCIYQSPVGKLLLAGDADGLQRISFECNIDVKDSWTEDRVYHQETIDQLTEYFNNKRTVFSIILNPHGTSFQQQVWNQLQKIQYNKTKYYAEIAEEIGNPKAARAIGMANNKNPIPIIIPCHRVIGKNGDLTGFASGLTIKQQLLDLEQNNEI
jgi:methylated-DNA-[protein]-cysteine S-methyltransferase